MKNFPHQLNKIPKLITALEVFSKLLEDGADVFDDGIYGYALARAGVYTFQKLPNYSNIDERIKYEKTKALSRQGARTCARELRRFFLMLGAVELISEGFVISNIGILILAAGNNMDSKVKSIWRDCLLNIVVEDENGSSHPYHIMLKLVHDIPGIERKRLALALEAHDDSESEYERVLSLAKNDNWEEMIVASKAKRENATKILPSLAIQISDIKLIKKLLYPKGIAPQAVKSGERIRLVTTRIVDSKGIASIPTFQDSETEAVPAIVDYSSTTKLIRERMIKHQQLVKEIAKILENCGYKLSENPMDCLATKEGSETILVEAKTLGNNNADEDKQVRLALGQLTYYENFYVIASPMPVKKIALFNKIISETHIDYLEKYDCFSLWISNDCISGAKSTLAFFEANGISLDLQE